MLTAAFRGYQKSVCKVMSVSFRCSLLVVFQLTTSSNWHELMNAVSPICL